MYPLSTYTHTIFTPEIGLVSSKPDFHLNRILFLAKEKSLPPKMESHPLPNVVKASNLKTLPRNKMAGFKKKKKYADDSFK